MLMPDAKRKLHEECTGVVANQPLFNELLYADDALTVSVDFEKAKLHMSCTEAAGFQSMACFSIGVNLNACFRTPSGNIILNREKLKCLEILMDLLANDGKVNSELNHRLGAARAEFDNHPRFGRTARFHGYARQRCSACVKQAFSLPEGRMAKFG